MNQCSTIKKNKDELPIEAVYLNKKDGYLKKIYFYSRNDVKGINRAISSEKKKEINKHWVFFLGGGRVYFGKIPSVVALVSLGS